PRERKPSWLHYGTITDSNTLPRLVVLSTVDHSHCYVGAVVVSTSPSRRFRSRLFRPTHFGHQGRSAEDRANSGSLCGARLLLQTLHPGDHLSTRAEGNSKAADRYPQ